MTFDTVSFFLGMVTLALLSWLGYQIVRIVELQQRDKAEWEAIANQPSASERYWGEHKQEVDFDEGSVTVIRPRRDEDEA